MTKTNSLTNTVLAVALACCVILTLSSSLVVDAFGSLHASQHQPSLYAQSENSKRTGGGGDDRARGPSADGGRRDGPPPHRGGEGPGGGVMGGGERHQRPMDRSGGGRFGRDGT